MKGILKHLKTSKNSRTNLMNFATLYIFEVLEVQTQKICNLIYSFLLGYTDTSSMYIMA